MLRWIQCEQGATAIEYAFIASLVSIAAVGTMGLLGDAVNMLIDLAANAFNG